MDQLDMFGQNVFLILGALLLLAAGAIVLVLAYIGLRVWIFLRLQRRSQRLYRERTRRADGQPYPPVSRGVCEACGRTGNQIYFPASGEELCGLCYEEFWQRTESAVPPSPHRVRML